MLPMAGNQGLQVDIGDSVAVGHHERAVVQIILDTLNPTAGHGFEPRFNEGHTPGFSGILMDLQALVADIEGDIAVVKKIVREVLFDHVALVTQADDEIVETIVAVDLHDMPEDRLISDLDHRFRLQMSLFRDTSAKTSCEDDYLQLTPLACLTFFDLQSCCNFLGY